MACGVVLASVAGCGGQSPSPPTPTVEPLAVPVQADGRALGTIAVGPGKPCATKQDAQDPTNDCKSINANFTAASGDLAQAAQLVGADHFNWLQAVVAEDDGDTVNANNDFLHLPYPDPPCGGYGDGSGISRLWADDLPWYLSETVEPGSTDTTSALQQATSASVLNLNDTPTNRPGTFNRFHTWLVAVEKDGTAAHYFSGFSWQVVMDDQGVGQLQDLRKLADPPDKKLVGQIAANGGCSR